MYLQYRIIYLSMRIFFFVTNTFKILVGIGHFEKHAWAPAVN